MAGNFLLKAIKDELRCLEVDSEVHRLQEDQKDLISNYLTSLTRLKNMMSELTQKTVTNSCPGKEETCGRLEEKEEENSQVGVIIKSNEFDEVHKVVLKELVPLVVVVVAAHTGKHYWTSGVSRKMAMSVIHEIMSSCGCKSISELLVGHSDPLTPTQSPYLTTFSDTGRCPLPRDDTSTGPIFSKGFLKEILVLLKAKLKRDSWKSHPNSKHALLWCLRKIKHPHVGSHLDSFLPPLLMLIDDHEIYHKALGLSGMTHLISNTDGAELKWHGRAEVVLEAIKPLLYNNEVDVINTLHPCLLKLLPVLDGPTPRTIDGPRKPGRADKVFSIFLSSMDMESKLAVRKAYSTHLSGYIELLGIFTVRHLKQLLSILFSYLEFPDYCGEETRVNSLNTLSCLMSNCWPRIPGHSESILKTLLKLLSDLCPDESTTPDKQDVQKQLPLICHCLVMLGRCHPEIKMTYKDLLVECNHVTLKRCLKNALKELEM